MFGSTLQLDRSHSMKPFWLAREWRGTAHECGGGQYYLLEAKHYTITVDSDLRRKIKSERCRGCAGWLEVDLIAASINGC